MFWRYWKSIQKELSLSLSPHYPCTYCSKDEIELLFQHAYFLENGSFKLHHVLFNLNPFWCFVYKHSEITSHLQWTEYFVQNNCHDFNVYWKSLMYKMVGLNYTHASIHLISYLGKRFIPSPFPQIIQIYLVVKPRKVLQQ